MGVLDKILAGAIVALLAVGGTGFFIHKAKVHRLEVQVQELQNKQLALEIEQKAKDATIGYLKEANKIHERVVNEKNEIDAVDPGRLDELYRRYRLHNPKGDPPPGEQRGDSQN